MASTDLLSIVGTIVFAATAFVLAARRAQMPTIGAYLLAGLAFGPALGLVELSGDSDADRRLPTVMEKGR